MATDPAAPENMTLDRADGSATIELYRAALGPVQLDYYLKAFTRFDAAGKTGPSWNWGAALLTLNWLAFRRLWSAALAYAGALTAALLFLFGILPLIVPVSQAALWALLALAVLLAVAVPGFFANAWLYAACNKAMDSAYSASATQEEACALLQRRAAGRARLGGLAAINLALCAALAALVLAWPGAHTLPLNSSQMDRARMETAAPPAATVAAVPAAPAAPAPASAAAPPSRSSQGLVQSTPATATTVAAPAPVASEAKDPASAASAAAPATRSSAPVPPDANPARAEADKAAQEKKAAAEKADADKVKKAEQQAAALAAKKAAKAEQAAKAAEAAKTAKPAAAPASADKAGTEKYLVNVGLFADANNARNAYTKLMDAGLPAQSQEISGAKGTRTRVRVGPFESRAEADAAADKIRALQLDALVFKP